MLKATKIRLYPTSEQCEALSKQFCGVHWLWNRALDMKSTAWKEHKENLSINTISAMFP